MAKLFIGTSGYNYGHWAHGVFYPQGLRERQWLEHYGTIFNSVELNVSFYTLPKRETFVSWRKRTDPGFVFAVKGSRYITHVKKLKECEEPVYLFLDHTRALGEKLGAVLWQLAPTLKLNLERLQEFCSILKKVDPAQRVRHTFEFRNQTWFCEPVYEVLKEHNLSLCIAHSRRYPRAEVVTTDFVYLRFHGGEVLDDSNYTDGELNNWAAKARNWLSSGKDVYAYFNNDAHGYAVQNALKLKELLGA